MGGAMDLVAGVKRVIVVMEHVNKKGESKIIPKCTLPLTGQKCIDMVITELCVLVMDPAKRRFTLTELAPGVSADDVVRQTEAEILIAPTLKTIAV
jgi:3-oxoacid CoA-transferase subunit B